MIRRKTRQIRVGRVKIGGGAPVSIQSMTKFDTSDVAAVVAQVKRLEAAGCEIVRFAIKDIEDAESVRLIKRKIGIPVVCDIHFDHTLALACIKAGADKIRLNPGNIKRPEDVRKVADAAKKAGIPIRVGVNSGSAGGSTPAALVGAAKRYIKMLEAAKFHDIIVSLKASDVASTVDAYRQMALLCDYPLHLGVTAAGSYESGIVKSSVGIGSLLMEGIGDTIRVSLTADPVHEVAAAKRILSSVGLRRFGPEVISCPTCGRCQVDLLKVVGDFERQLYAKRCTLYAKHPLTIALMGCEVNGPGEAKEADIGIAAGKGTGVLFKRGKVVKRVPEEDFVTELLRQMRNI